MLPKYSLIELNESSLTSFSGDIEKNHTILKLSDNLNISQDKISLFLKLTSSFKENGMSFVVIQSGIDIDNFPEELNIVPTLQEAEDILEMEAIERDLGF